MKQLNNLRILPRLFGFTAGGALVVILYVIIPLLITLMALYPGSTLDLWGAFGLLVVGEIIIYAVVTTTMRGYGQVTGHSSRAVLAQRIVSRVKGSSLAVSWPLLLILGVQSVVSLSLNNTTYQDEALYLYAGRQLFQYLIGLSFRLEYGTNSFSGLPYLYPLLAGALDLWGGLALARSFSLFWMLCATVSVYAITRTLFNRSSAIFGAALFATQSSVLFLGHFATYDSMSASLIAISASLALRAGSAQKPWLALVVGVLLLIAAATKYVGLLFVPPVIALLAWQTHRSCGWRQALVRVSLVSSVFALSGIVALILMPGAMNALLSTSLNRTIAYEDDRLLLARRVLALAGPVLGLGLLGVLRNYRRTRWLALGLFVSALLAPAYHIYNAEFISLHKHIAFGLIFAAPLAGYAMTSFGDRRRMVTLALSLVILSMGVQGSQNLYQEWPNSAALVQTIRQQTLPDNTRVLAEVAYEPRYYLQGNLNWEWTNLWAFRYTDAAGQLLKNEDAYKAAINEGYFDVIELSYGPNRETNAMAQKIDDALIGNKRYTLVAKVPYQSKFGSGYYWLWRRK